MPIKLLSSGGGSVIVNATSTGSNFTVNVPAVNGNIVTTADTGTITQAMISSGFYAGYGPAFYAYNGGSNQSVTSGVITKLSLTSTLFDTASSFNTSTYRYVPTIAGYYQVNCNVLFSSVGISTSYVGVQLYKNGSSYLYTTNHPNNGNWAGSFLSTLVYLNGSTDYIEMYAQYQGSGTWQAVAGAGYTSMSGYLARAS